MKLLNEIRDTLTDPLLRAGYDERLRLESHATRERRARTRRDAAARAPRRRPAPPRRSSTRRPSPPRPRDRTRSGSGCFSSSLGAGVLVVALVSSPRVMSELPGPFGKPGDRRRRHHRRPAAVAHDPRDHPRRRAGRRRSGRRGAPPPRARARRDRSHRLDVRRRPARPRPARSLRARALPGRVRAALRRASPGNEERPRRWWRRGRSLVRSLSRRSLTGRPMTAGQVGVKLTAGVPEPVGPMTKSLPFDGVTVFQLTSCALTTTSVAVDTRTPTEPMRVAVELVPVGVADRRRRVAEVVGRVPDLLSRDADLVARVAVHEVRREAAQRGDTVEDDAADRVLVDVVALDGLGHGAAAEVRRSSRPSPCWRTPCCSGGA